MLILGATFKEDCPDFRNSKVFDVRYFIKKRINFEVYDPYFKKEKIDQKYLKFFTSSFLNNTKKYDVVAILVSHKQFKTNIKKLLNILKKIDYL